jgi:two-component system CheB/CheR fusion protein
MKVLVVEDSNDVAVVIQMLLKSAGHQPLLASDATSALELCRRDKPDFVLTDIRLPDFDGYELARRLRDECGLGDTPIWALSAYADNEERRKWAGITGHIDKPISFAHIQQIIG